MTWIEELRSALSLVQCSPYQFFIHEDGQRAYLQAEYDEPDTHTGVLATQKTRKWRLSPHMTRSELVQTALKCALTSAEHRIREAFRYRGEQVYGPHFDVDALAKLCRAPGTTDRRVPPL